MIRPSSRALAILAVLLPAIEARGAPADPLARVLVLARGRVKPCATHAREVLVERLGSASFGGGDALRAYASMVLDPGAWIDAPCLRVPEAAVGRILGGRTMVSPRAVLSAREELASVQGSERAAAGPRGGQTPIERAVLELWSRASFLSDAASTFRVAPDPTSAEGEWLAMSEARRLRNPELDACLEGLGRAWRAGDEDALARRAAELRALQGRISPRGSATRPTPGWLVELEIAYYSVNVRAVGLSMFAACAAAYAIAAWARSRRIGRLAGAMLALGIAWNLWILGGHTAMAGRLPLKNLHEVFLVVLFFVPLIGAFLARVLRSPLYSALSAALTAVGFVGSLFLEPSGYFVGPLVAILRSPWREVHILTIMLSYAILLVAAGLHATFLALSAVDRARARRAPGASGPKEVGRAADRLFRDADAVVAWGFLLLTVGISTGAAWAHSSWGRYWGWDPKEVWATVAWAIYGLFLHARIFFRWPRGVLAGIGIVGYAAILFTYFGVSYWLPGLHAYR